MSEQLPLRGVGLSRWRPAMAAAALLTLVLVLVAALPGGFVRERGWPSPAPPALARAHSGLSSLPWAAQGPVSAALGAERSAYRVRRSSGGLWASNPTQGISVQFGRSGVLVSGRDVQVGFELRAVGYGASLLPLGAVAPSAIANRVSYAWPGLLEWYANGPLGLEQGFTLNRALGRDRGGPLTLALALTGNARATVAAGAESLTLARRGRPSVRYSGLQATDARGRTLHSWLQLENGRLLIRVDARGARYPLRVDPFIQQGEKITAAEESGKGSLGTAVAISADGSTALIGADSDEELKGAAWVFTRSGGAWTQQGKKLTASAGLLFGDAVALSADGNTALIAGGAGAFVFTRSGGVWTQQGGSLTAGTEDGGVALSADGNTALVGSADEGEGGVARVFVRSGGVWSQQGEALTGSGATAKADFGDAVALSADGNTALIGARFDKPNGGADEGTGAAFVFTRKEGVWKQQGSKLTGSDEIGYGDFGYSVALAADGNTALIGGPHDKNLSPCIGAAWAFERAGSVWGQQGSKFVGFGGTGESLFGFSVALSADGNTALIGGLLDNSFVGAAWLWQRVGSSWGQLGAKLTASGESGKADFGWSVALSSDANTALIGGPGDHEGLGAAWSFVNPPEYGRCLKVTAGGGKYENSGCTKGGGTKQFEWYPAFGGAKPLVKPGFTTKIKELTELKLETTSKATIACTGETSTGEYTGDRSIGSVVMTLTGCHRGALGKCQSASAKEGEIVTKALEGHLGVIKTSTEGLVKYVIGTELAAPGLGTVAEFACAGTPVKLLEGVIVQVKTNSMVSSETLKFVQSKGVQKPHQFVEYPFGELLQIKFGEEIFPTETGLALTTIQTNAEKVEVNSTL